MTRIEDFATRLVEAHDAATPWQAEGWMPETVEEAYAIQTSVLRAYGPAGAFKAALQPEGPAIFAPIRADRCLAAGAEVRLPARAALELEVGWKVIAALPAVDTPDFADRLRASILPVPAIELVAPMLAGPLADTALPKLAGGLNTFGLITGTPLSDWNGEDFGEVSASLTIDGAEQITGVCKVPGGSALTTLIGFLQAAGDHCGGLQPGQVLITGTVHPILWTDLRGHVVARIEGLGEVSLTTR